MRETYVTAAYPVAPAGFIAVLPQTTLSTVNQDNPV